MASELERALPTAIYGGVFLLAGVAWLILQRTIISAQGRTSRLREVVGRDMKGRLSAVMYAVAIGVAFANVTIAITIYVLVALLWLIPDQRIERAIGR